MTEVYAGGLRPIGTSVTTWRTGPLPLVGEATHVDAPASTTGKRLYLPAWSITIVEA